MFQSPAARVSLPLIISLLSLAGPSDAQDNSSQVVAGAAYSSVHGAVGSLGFEASDLFGSGLDLGVEYRKGDSGQAARARLRYSHDLGGSALGGNSRLVLSFSHAASDWDDDAYSSQQTRLGLGIAADIAPEVAVSAGLFWRLDRIDDIRIDASPLILAEQGRSNAGGLQVGLSFGHLEGGVLARSGQSFDTMLTWSALGDRRFASLELSGTMAREIASGWTVAVHGETGAIFGQDGQGVSIHDRSFLGGAAPRGFAVGGVGPRDYVAGSIDTPLGGNRYVLGSFELRKEVSDTVTLGAFVDVGSNWSLSGSPVGAGGPIDDSYFLRSSGGLALYWKTGLGTISLNVAKPIRKRETDELNNFGLNVLTSF